MEVNRIEVRNRLSDIMTECGEEPHLYFQPNESSRLTYPCMIYHLKTLTTRSANNRPYYNQVSFDITYITRSPVSDVPMKMLEDPMFSFDRYYTAENLHHYSYTTRDSIKKGGQS